MFEFDAFANGTKALMDSVVAKTQDGGITIIGGGMKIVAWDTTMFKGKIIEFLIVDQNFNLFYLILLQEILLHAVQSGIQKIRLVMYQQEEELPWNC